MTRGDSGQPRSSRVGSSNTFSVISAVSLTVCINAHPAITKHVFCLVRFAVSCFCKLQNCWKEGNNIMVTLAPFCMVFIYKHRQVHYNLRLESAVRTLNWRDQGSVTKYEFNVVMLALLLSLQHIPWNRELAEEFQPGSAPSWYPSLCLVWKMSAQNVDIQLGNKTVFWKLNCLVFTVPLNIHIIQYNKWKHQYNSIRRSA